MLGRSSRRSFLLGPALAVALLQGCVDLSRSPDSEETLADAPPHVVEAVDACSGEGGRKLDCYEPRILARLEAGGVQDALSTLETIAAVDLDVRRDGHVYTHAIGITAYQQNPTMTEIFPACSELFQSGCYHGVIQAHFMAAGTVDVELVNSLCESYKGVDGDRWVLFQCLHGMGHGLTMFYGHDLPRALADCDLLRDGWDRQSCYGGGFMENIVNATSPHHLATELVEGSQAGAGQEDEAGSEGEAEGHQHAAASTWQALDPDDPLYPCSVLEPRYLRECYMMQTSAMLSMNGGNFGDAAKSCGTAPENMRQTCYQSLGRDASSYALQDIDRALDLCGRGEEQYRGWCYVGVAKHFIDLTARTDRAFEFCRALESPAAKGMCYEAIGEEVGVLRNANEARAELCSEAESEEYERFCLYGARVISTR